MDYYVKGDAAKAHQIKAAFEKLGIDVLDFGFADKTVVYCSIGGACVQSLPYSINLMHILYSHSGYRELELPVEHEFKAEDWIVSTRNSSLAYRILESNISSKPGKLDYKVEIYSDGIYEKTCLIPSDKMDEWGRLWTIEDAKDGHVLVDEDTNTIGVFEKTYGICWHSKIYCANSTYKKVYYRGGSHEIKFTKPATKEQRDLLFTRVREAGYEWDAEKKEFRKTIDESNFKVGDWVAGIDDEGDVATEKIVSFSHDKVLLLDTDGCHTEYPKTELSNFHLWTIADAKDGDVLVSGIDNPFIYDGDIEFSSAGAYVGVSRNGRIRLDMFPSRAWTSVKDVKPATREQRDLLFAKLREAGYQLDAGKKELRKIIIEPIFKVGDEIFRPARNEYFKIKDIEKGNGIVWYVTTRTRLADNDKRIGEILRINAFYQNEYSIAPSTHYDISNFYAGMPVLVRDDDGDEWNYLLFSHYRKKFSDHFFAGGSPWSQCIPCNYDTKHLLGTTDPCDERFINW